MELSRLSAGDVEEARQSSPKQIRSESDAATSKTLGFGVPPGRRDNTFESFDLKRAPKMREAYEQCAAVVNGDSWCAFLWGDPGNGKTHLAIAALARYAGIFWKVPDFLAYLRKQMSEGVTGGWGGDGVEQVVSNYRVSTGLVVLDDLGVENQTDWANEQLYRVLDGRYESRAPTIITSNAPLDSISVRIRSRFKEGWVVCEGKDLR